MIRFNLTRSVVTWGTLIVASMSSSQASAQVGACCLGNGDCIKTTSGGCNTVSGEFIGDDTTCADAVCIGACCEAELECTDTDSSNCEFLGGEYHGAGSTCFTDCATKLGSSFTYQGRLVLDGVPVSDTADFVFSLWSSANGAEQIGIEATLLDVEVKSGLFSVDLDFGFDVFDGSTRWMEVAIRSPHDPQDLQPYNTLTPRQHLAPAPYSLQTRGISVQENGRVAIGNVSSLSQLNVLNNIRVVDEDGFGIAFSSSSQHGVISWVAPNGSNSVLRVRPEGLGIYRQAVSNVLEVGGNASKSVAGSWLSNSDKRIKTEIEPVRNAVETLLKVNPVSFRYTDEYLKANPEIKNRRYLNVIAQEFAEVFPEAVHVSNELLPDGSKILQVDTYPITIYAAAAVRELHERLEAKEQKIEEQSDRLDQLMRHNRDLADRISAIELRLSRPGNVK